MQALSAQKLILKSNMDRFIEKKTVDSTAMLSTLKSNMDRFIAAEEIKIATDKNI